MFEATKGSRAVAQAFGLGATTPCGVVADYLEELGYPAESIRQGEVYDKRVELAASVLADRNFDFSTTSKYFEITFPYTIRGETWAVTKDSVYQRWGDTELIIYKGRCFLKGCDPWGIQKVTETGFVASGILGYPIKGGK